MKLHLIGSLILSLLFFCACNKNNEHEKYEDFSKNIVNIQNKIVSVKTNLILGKSEIATQGKFLLLNNFSSLDNGFYLFDKKTFKYITSTGSKGQGPGEIINYGNAIIIPNTVDNKSFYVVDYSQLSLYQYCIDSVLHNKNYRPKEVLKMHLDRTIGNVSTLNDSVFMGVAMKMINKHSFVNEIVRFNINSGKMQKIMAINPDVENIPLGSHSTFSLFPSKNKFVQAYRYVDLLSIYGVKGNLICNIYGNLWNKRDNRKFKFHQQIEVGKKYIIASYVGGKKFKIGTNKRTRGVFASKFLIFDLEGNYIKTLNIGEEIRSFCLDEDNNRIIMNCYDRDEPLAYIDLKGILN